MEVEASLAGKPYPISLELKVLLMCEPMLMAFATIMDHRHMSADYEAMNGIACTDGNTVWYGTKYTACQPKERAFIFAHELMHGIFRHGDRASLVRLTKGAIYPVLWNIAGDAIINEAIITNPAMMSGLFAIPAAFPPIRMASIHTRIQEAITVSGKEAPSSYDPKALNGQNIETIYEWLVWGINAVNNKREKDKKSNEGQSGGEGTENGAQDASSNDKDEGQEGKSKNGKEGLLGKEPGAGNSGPGGPAQPGKGVPDDQTQLERDVTDGGAWDLIEQIGRIKEMLDKGISANDLIEQINSRIEEARLRIEQVVQSLKLRGIGRGNMLVDLACDLPKPVVPWNHLLRRVATKGLGTKLVDSHTRHGTSTMTALARGQRRVPYSPGTTIFSDRARVLVVLDVSGSHVSMLPVCFSEIWSIVQMKGAAIDLITFDDGVQESLEIKSRADFNRIMARGIKGNGGTELFNGVFEQVKKKRIPYKMAIIMTDGYLTTTENKKPDIPVLWMVTPGGNTNFEFGEVISLPEYMG